MANQYIDPLLPIPQTLYDELRAAGFTPDDLTQLATNVAAVHASIEEERREVRGKDKGQDKGMSR